MELTDKQFKQEIQAEAERYEEEFQALERPFMPGDGEVRDLIAYWEESRPKMVARLKKLGILQEFAIVSITRADDQLEKNLSSGMYITDARESAARNKLMWPEAWDEEAEEQTEDELE